MREAEGEFAQSAKQGTSSNPFPVSLSRESQHVQRAHTAVPGHEARDRGPLVTHGWVLRLQLHRLHGSQPRLLRLSILVSGRCASAVPILFLPLCHLFQFPCCPLFRWNYMGELLWLITIATSTQTLARAASELCRTADTSVGTCSRQCRSGNSACPSSLHVFFKLTSKVSSTAV